MTSLKVTRQRSEGRIEIAIQRLLRKYPFHARILEQFILLSRDDVGTMGVSANNDSILLLHNPDFVGSLPLDQLTGVLLHEVHHVLFRHLLMKREDYPDQWALTIAQEVTVNEFVKEPLPDGVITLKLYPNLPPMESTEKRYGRLRKVTNRIPIGKPNLPFQDQTSKTVDDHDVWATRPQNVDEVENVIEEMIDAAASEVSADQIDQIPRALRRMAGVTSGDDQTLIMGGLTGQLDWRAVLRRYVGQLLQVRPTFTRPPRRFPHLVGIFPGRRRQADHKRIMAVLDTSASMTQDLLERVNAELEGLARSYTVTVVECDTSIKSVYKYRPVKKVTGRGGTDFRPPLKREFLSKHRPDVVVYFTDGFGPAPAKSPRMPVIWCLTPYGERPASWGRAIKMDEHNVASQV